MGFFGNVMNNYFYGKAGKGDYRVEDMPQNRFQLFSATWKVRWASMCGVNLLYMISWIPTLIWIIVHISLLFSGSEDILNGNAVGLMTMFLTGLVPCIFITGPFTAGVTYVLRNWARDEHSFVWSDFWDAVKGNWKQALPVSLISGLMPLVAYVGWIYYGQMANGNFIFYIPMGLTIVIALVWKLSEMVIYTLMVTYDLKLKDLIRNAVLLTVARFPHALAIKLSNWIIPAIGFAVIWFAPSVQIWVILILILVYIVYLPAFNRFIQASFANYVCEKFLNPRIEGARTNIGLRPENWDDTEYIPQDDEE